MFSSQVIYKHVKYDIKQSKNLIYTHPNTGTYNRKLQQLHVREQKLTIMSRKYERIQK